jgi:hypothetical protein
LRRLLYFGTGAAIIGILLLLAAFYASYAIVANLQNELANNTNVNLVLEDATLEAIFLGVMASIGYILVNQGLSGIRREEMLDIEGSVEEAVAARQERIRVKGVSRPIRSTRGPPESAKMEPSPQNGGDEDMPAPVVVAAASPSPQTPTVASSTAQSQVMASKAAEPTGFSWTTTPVEAPKPVAEEPPQAVYVPPAPAPIAATPAPEPPAQPAVIEAASSPEIAGKAEMPAVQSPPVEAPAPATAPAAVVWEGGPPPKLEGVDILPEPPEHGVLQVEKPDVAADETPTPDFAPAPPKRGRGRPKGSRNKKPEDQQI